MDNSDLINVLESLLGPAVAGINAPVSRRGAQRMTGQPAPVDVPAMGAPDGISGRSSITALLSAEMPVGIAVLDAISLRVRRANSSLLSMLSEPWRERDVVGRQLHEIAPGLTDSEVEAAFRRVARTGQPFSAIVEEEQPGGPIYRRCTLSAIRMADGSFTELLLTLLDVSDQMAARQRAEHETQRAEERAHRVEEQALRSSIRSAAVQALARVGDLTDALGRVAERTAESLGDYCAVFLLGEDDVLDPAALYHRDRVQGLRLRPAYADYPLRRGEGIEGQVVLSGNGFLATHWGPEDLALIPPTHRHAIEGAQIASLVCVPLREAARSFGALMLFSARETVGGSGRIYSGADLVFLQELADQMAQAVQNVRLREALRSSEAEREVLLQASSEGIAIYDAQGRLRHLNAMGRQLLSRPVDPSADQDASSGMIPARRTWMTPEGLQLGLEELPWTRALAGESVGLERPTPILVEWTGGAQRTLHVRALPVYDGGNHVGGVVVMMGEATREGGDAASQVGREGDPAGEAEWARWRETMELLDDGVVLCDADGHAVFVNTAGRSLLNLPDDAMASAGSGTRDNVWVHLCRPDGLPLAVHETPGARALAGDAVQGLETGVLLARGALRRIFWDARRIDRADGETLGVVLIARPANEASPGTEPTQAELEVTRPISLAAEGTQPVAQDYAPAPLAPTTLLPGRSVAEHEAAHATGDETGCDLAEACARVARSHGGVQGRRLEIRLPRRKVLVASHVASVESLLDVLISSAVAGLPAHAPLHVAVWVERARDGAPDGPASLIPHGVDADQIDTMVLKDGRLPDLVAPTRAVGSVGGLRSAVAIVRVCSPNVRAPMAEPPEFEECCDLAGQMGGRAWAREDPILGPTFSLSLPLVEPAG